MKEGIFKYSVDARKPIAVPVRKLSVYLQPFPRDFYGGYRSSMPPCAGFLEPRKSRLGLLKSTFNAENVVCSLSMSVSVGFGAIHYCSVSRNPKSSKNP